MLKGYSIPKVAIFSWPEKCDSCLKSFTSVVNSLFFVQREVHLL